MIFIIIVFIVRAEDELESDRGSNRISGRWPEMTSLSCRSRGSERIDSRAALDRR